MNSATRSNSMTLVAGLAGVRGSRIGSRVAEMGLYPTQAPAARQATKPVSSMPADFRSLRWAVAPGSSERCQ